MNTLVSLIVAISAHGYWLGGTTGTLTFKWPADSQPPAARLDWVLCLGPTQLSGGTVDVPDARKKIAVRVAVPPVRVATPLRFVFKLIADDGASVLASGERLIHVYPSSLLADYKQRFASRHVVLVDADHALEKLLLTAGVSADRITDCSKLGLMHPDIVIIAPEALTASPYAQPDLASMAAAGGSIVVFHQSLPGTIGGYTVRRKTANGELNWRFSHPLLNELDAAALDAWSETDESLSIELPSDEAALEIGWWKPAVATDQPAPISAMLLTKTVGQGQIILCQLPTPDWSQDARAQILLNNVLDFLLAPLLPTPAPSKRAHEELPPRTQRNAIKLTPGVMP